MINVQDVVGGKTTTWGREDVASPNHEITIYTSPGAPPAHFLTQAPFLLRRMGVVTDDGGRLVGWFGPREMAYPSDVAPEAWAEVARVVDAYREMAEGYREMAERIKDINAALQRLQERLEAEERAQEAAPTPRATLTAPHLGALAWIKEATGLSDDRVAALVGVSRQTLNRWRRGEAIADDKRRRVFAVRDVLERAARRHPRVADLGTWLDTPREAEGRTPSDLLVNGEIDKARLWAVTSAADTVVPPPAWARASVTAPAGGSGERHQEALAPWYEDDINDPHEDDEPDVFVPLELDEA